MGGSMAFEKLGVKAIRDASILLAPVVSVWDCIVRKMRYSFRPEWNIFLFEDNKLNHKVKRLKVMEKVSRGGAPQVLRKEKKKQAKDELDRWKQAEKKKRRLEKALANSAAIRSELEKKKQKEKEEQERLDEEGAAIAEAVALHVLLGEDADESCQVMLKNSKRFNSLDHSSNSGLSFGYQSIANYSAGPGWLSASYSPWCTWSYLGSGRSLSPAVHVKDLQLPYHENRGQGADISAGFIAAQAVSSLQIAENLPKDSISGQRAATIINTMLGGNNLHDKVNLYNVF